MFNQQKPDRQTNIHGHDDVFFLMCSLTSTREQNYVSTCRLPLCLCSSQIALRSKAGRFASIYLTLSGAKDAWFVKMMKLGVPRQTRICLARQANINARKLLFVVRFWSAFRAMNYYY
jgi:hypothetical protein